ncbi:hypothetical protein M2161_009134 [Streptomyces sp. SAI-133]|uniref:hypothetical protein n=1 Tax=unclassified Streptomyces TaxID=2593676 RepID=UPI0024759638|nr:hypothetical protein [Streptomyces sp. SAI-133]MDH6589943.1 hypothetical protein [Streptomyces sp. SAI-133]
MSDGGQSCEPVREIVERTQTVVRTVVLRDQDTVPLAPRAAQRLNGEPYTLPADAVEWIEALAALRREVDKPEDPHLSPSHRPRLREDCAGIA